MLNFLSLQVKCLQTFHCIKSLFHMQSGISLHIFYSNSFCSFPYLNRQGVLACFEAKTTFLLQEFYQKLRSNLNTFSIFKTFSLLTYIFPTVWIHSHAWFIVMARVLGRDCYAELSQSYFAEVSGWNQAAIWLWFSLLTSIPLPKRRETQKCQSWVSATWSLHWARVPWPGELWHFRQAADLDCLLQ